MTHKIRNFGEVLWQEIEQKKLGDIGGLETVDCATDRLTVKIYHRKKIDH
ncbi:hypothetical protein [Parasulfitobacter algicola]|uniref:Uncharacterized protein n=1 Tax=Parasulfitobacter algicola TaxID=2614809 RepID=A0ABX2IZA8_9RHOB|nr:hypothetical protein [Sulfitobacter algicola]NSX56049.1 hypothetical protein [Sulfitobacter algicola]